MYSNQTRVNLWELFGGKKKLALDKNILMKKNAFSLGVYKTLIISEVEKKGTAKIVLGYQEKQNSVALTMLFN